MSLLDVLRGVMLDPAEQAAYNDDPSAYLERYGYDDVDPADLSEAFGLVADTLPPDQAQAAWAAAGPGPFGALDVDGDGTLDTPELDAADLDAPELDAPVPEGAGAGPAGGSDSDDAGPHGGATGYEPGDEPALSFGVGEPGDEAEPAPPDDPTAASVADDDPFPDLGGVDDHGGLHDGGFHDGAPDDGGLDDGDLHLGDGPADHGAPDHRDGGAPEEHDGLGFDHGGFDHGDLGDGDPGDGGGPDDGAFDDMDDLGQIDGFDQLGGPDTDIGSF